MPAKILIAGGGFGGLYAARELERRLEPEAVEITLVNDGNFLLYAPLLPGVGGGTLEPRHVVVPLREELRRTDVRVGTVVGADLERLVVRMEPSQGGTEKLSYDHLIVALGSTSMHPKIPGLPEHAIPFKSVADALALRNRIMVSFERAEGIDDPKERASHLSYVFAGGGYKTRGLVVGLGRHKGVASLMGVRLRGFPAWFVGRSYHLAAMPGTRRRARLMSDWTLAMLFKRDSAQLGGPSGAGG